MVSDSMVESEIDLNVEVAYARPEKQLIIQLQVPRGTTVFEIIEHSEIRLEFPEIDERPTVGIFGRKVDLDHQPGEGDRVEIYRPLLADPKEMRRLKAEQERAVIKKQQKRN